MFAALTLISILIAVSFTFIFFFKKKYGSVDIPPNCTVLDSIYKDDMLSLSFMEYYNAGNSSTVPSSGALYCYCTNSKNPNVSGILLNPFKKFTYYYGSRYNDT